MSIDLECMSAFYDEVKIMPKFGNNTVQQLNQYLRELDYIVKKNMLQGQGFKAALSLQAKLTKVKVKHQTIAAL